MKQLAAAFLAAAVLAAPASAIRPLTPPAPPIPEDAAWVNAAPLSMELLRGKRVVIISFLNLNNLRSRRAARVLTRWWDRYALSGLMIIGVHTPDFEFDRDPLQVRRSARRAGFPFPLVIDTRSKLWEGYRNEGWPAFYLVDHRGRIVNDKLGEGGYGVFEREILAALETFNGYAPALGAKLETDPKRIACGTATPSFYLGSRRGIKMRLLGKDSMRPVVESRDGELAVSGDWEEDTEAVRYKGSAPMRDQLYLIWRGAEAGAVLSPGSGKPVKIFIKQDNLWLHAGNAGSDVRWDDTDQSFVLVDEGRLYDMAKDPNKDRLHEMSLYPEGPGATVHGFEFSDHCEQPVEAK